MIHFPLSSNQKSIWNTQKILPNSSIFNIGGYAVINESIDVNVFNAAISDLVKTNEVLAININDDIAYFTQNVDLNFTLDKIDYLDYSADGISAISLCKQWMDNDIKATFELDGPLFKTVLFKINNKKYCWYLKIHHIIADGYSFALLFNKLSAIYNRLLYKTKVEDETAETIKLNFSDFVADEISYTNSFRYKSDKDYWVKTFENIPITKATVKADNLHSRRKEVIIDRTKFNEMTTLCKLHNIQPLHCLIAVFHIFYSKISQNDHLIVGIPVLNRNNAAFKNMAGTFFNVLPMLFKYDQNKSVIDIGNLVKSNLTSAYRHQRFPINDLMELLDHKGSLYDVMFSYQKVHYNQFIKSNTEINFLHNSEMFYDLAIHLLEYDEKKDLKLLCDYRAEAVNEYEVISLIEGIIAFIGNFDTLIESKNNTRSISDLLYSEMLPNKDYWKNKLSNSIPKITISQDFPPTTNLTYKSDSIKFTLKKDIKKEIERFNSIHQSSLLTVILTSIKVLLYKYTEEKDITVGIPILQTVSGLDEQIGPYLNILPLRDELDAKESFINLLSKVRQTVIDAYNHKAYPIDFMIEDLDLSSDQGIHTLFDLLLIVNDNKIGKKKSSYSQKKESISEQLDLKNKTYLSKNNIIIKLLESDAAIQFGIEYNANLHLKERIQRFGDHLKKILEQVLKDADTHIDDITILNEKEKQKIIKYSEPEAVFKIKNTVLERFSEQVSKTPNQIAVIFEDKKLTYKDLDIQSDQVSYYLRKKITVKREDMVGLILEHSEQLAVITLGILKSGCAYVAIDNNLPEDRKKFMLEDSGCKIVITEVQYASEIEKYWKGNVIIIDTIPSGNDVLPKLKSDPEDCAFVIYTSGSTGVPKGVLQTHKCLLNVVMRQVEYGGFERNLNVLQYSSISFDVFIAHELFFALLSGGCLHIISENLRKDLNALGKYIVEKEIEWLLLPVSVLNTIVEVSDELWQENIKLKHIVSAGEQLNLGKKLISYLVNHPAIRLHNFYGPSETHNASNYTLLDTHDIGIEQPIGRPSVNTWIHILSKDKQLVPVGIPGELYISGSSLAKGYINRPDMTSERFIANPYLHNELMYKTGDIGKWLPDGNIKFLGRKDDQVKIRGYRVELGEIENALLKHPKVKQCAVIAPMDKFSRELIGYIVSEEDVLTAELRAFLLKSLPEYMVPSYYVKLEKLPVNSNGKIDRKSLPDTKGISLSSGVEYVAPRNALEEKMVKIWEEVLKREKIGVKDDFFALSGHSLKAVRLNNEYQKELSVKLSLKDLFAHTCIASQAELIQSSKKIEFIQIEKVVHQVSYAISDGQRRLWVLNQFGDGSAAYNMPGSIYLNQDIDLDSFQRAIYSTIDRHEILRTVFKVDETGEIRQWIVEGKDLGFEIEYKDFGKENAKEEKVKEYIAGDSYKVFDLAKGPLLRASLLKLADEAYVFYFNMHHIISDGWSMEVLRKDIFSYYEAYKEKKEVALKPLRIQYKDYSSWQLAQLEEASYKAHRTYWLRSLEGELPVLDLPLSKQRPRIKSSNGYGLSTYLDSGTTRKLKKYSEETGGSLFMGLLAAWNILMYRYTGQKDIITGIPIAGREHADLEDQIGFYVNTLALRNKINPEENFNNFYNTVKDNTLKSYSHQMYPFDRLVEELDLQRDTSRSAVFDIMLVLQNNGEKIEGLQLKKEELNQIVDLGASTSKFDLEINVQERGDYLCLHVVYNPDVYEQEMVEGLITHYRQLLHAILENPEEQVSKLDYLSEEEKHNLLYTFNATQVSYPEKKTIVDLFEEQVAKTPNHIAVVFEEKELTYQELDERSNQLAAYLQKNYKIKADDLVGIKLERSEWMIISILGVLKSAGAYVPIDPSYPQDRMDYIEKDTNYKVCIDEKEIKKFRKDQKNYSTEQIRSKLKSANLAYVIYTSGSTGMPKGVMITHRNVVRLFKTNKPLFDFNESDVWTMFHSYAFDFSVWEMYGALFFGGKLVIVPKLLAQDTSLYLSLIERERVTVLSQTPSVFYNLSKEEENSNVQLKQVRYVIFGGEALSPGKLQHWRDQYPSCKLINMYGITETTVHTTYKEISQEDIILNRSNIGKAIPTVSCMVLDQNKNLVPIGITGELYVGGEGIALGYLNREELTNERFITHTFEQRVRLYRTGDMAKQLPNGDFEYLGRTDNQVKIRGHRIELGEIEHALLKNKQIETAVVLVRENQNNEKDLVAYITSNSEQNTSELRNSLKELLPGYMLPAYYVQLEALPLTINGKIDKKSLPDPQGLGLASGVEYVAPRSELEEKLVEIWSEILYIDKEKIGIKDNFFELGGDSIKTLRLISSLRKRMDYELSVTDIYHNDTIEKIVTHNSENREEIDVKNKEREAREKNIRSEMDALKERILLSEKMLDKENIEDLYPMSDIEKGMVFANLMNEGTSTYHDQMVFQNNFFEFNLERFKKALMLLTQKHSILRTGFNLSDYECEIQIVYKNLKTELYYEDISDLTKQVQEEAIKDYLESERDRGFIITNAPLWRMSVFALGQDNYAFIMQFHHAIIDGWSQASFMTELNNLYVKLGEDITYKPLLLKSNYKDFIVHNKINLEDDSIKNFWKKEMSGYERLDLFTEEDESVNYSYSYDTDYLKTVENAAKILNTTVKVVSLAAYLYMLKVLNYNPEIVTGLITNIRPGVEDGDKVLGCFLNSIPLRVHIDGSILCADFITSVHNKLIELKNNEALSTLEIATICQEKSEHANPFFDVFFNYIDFHMYQDLVKDESAEAGHIARSNLNYERTNTFLDFTVNTTGAIYNVILNATKKLKSDLSLERLSDLYFKILDFIIKDIDKPLKDINYLNEKEKQKIIKYSEPEAVFKIKNTVLERFSEQVSKTPNQIAVIFEGKKLTYKDLDIQSDQVSYYLRKKITVKREDVVGIILDRSEQLAVITLGILKSGCAYVAIDHTLPAERKKYILEDSGCKILITEVQYASEIEKYWKGNVIIIDTIPSGNDVLPKLKSDPEDCAFVIYTSGSTGVPKGILQTHKCLLNVVMRQVEYGGFERNLNVLQYSSISFDVFIAHELFFTLLSGGCLHIISENLRKDLNALGKYIVEKEIEWLLLPVSALNTIVEVSDELWQENIKVKHIVSAGEQLNLSKKLISYLVNHPAIRLHNFYGPSETHNASNYTLLDTHDIGIEQPIGRPSVNTWIHILSKDKQLVPVGIPGELYISGSGLAKGYINRPDMTSERFIANPYLHNELMYKTGDIGKWLPDGNIKFLGRKDDQIKIRGYRVELGEIENALLKHPKVKQCAVIASMDNFNRELIGYIVSEEDVLTAELRAFLLKSLPEYMVPGYYMNLEKLPLTSNGKVDRKALPDTKAIGLSSGIEYVAARNETEEKLVTIWEELLQREKIGVKDDFFALGGHSLKAVRLSNEYQKALSVSISLKDLFLHTSIELQAELIQSSKRSDFIQIEKVAHQVSYAISDGQRRLWVLSQFGDSSTAYNMPGSIHLNQDINIDCFQRAIYSTIDRHEILRTVFKVDETGEIRQWIVEKKDLGFKIDYKDFRKQKNKEELVQFYISEDSYKPFDLEKGPLLRASLLQLKDKEYVFYFNMHHIISDGWSMEVLSNDILSYYEANKENKEVALQPLRIQYKDYSAWQLAQLEEESFKAHRAYWLNSLRGELPLLDLPATKQRPNLKTSNGHGVSTCIDSITTSRLKKYSKVNGGTLYMGLLAAWNTLMYCYTGQKDIITGIPIAGREHADLEDQIGFYLNTLALRNEINPEESFNELFSRVKQTTLSAYSHQMYPFDRLVEELDIQRDTSRSAVFDVMLVLQNNEKKTQEADFKKEDPIAIELNRITDHGYVQSKFDINISVQEIDNYLSLYVVFNSDVYEREMVENLINHYRQLIINVLENPEGKISEIDYLLETERQKLLVSFNDTKTDFPKDKTIVDLFEEQVAKTPDNVAVVFEEKKLTYKQLDELSNQLAHYLQKNYTIKPDDLIGIKQERSEWMMISILGVLKSGGAYVPIDSDYPAERIAYLIKNSGCKVCIDEAALITFRDQQKMYSVDKLRTKLRPHSLAYVIYTSGSTGKPKGVMIEHRSLINYNNWFKNTHKINQEDSSILISSPSFDGILTCIYGCILNGGSLHLLRKDVINSPAEFIEYVKSKKITFLKATPPYLNLIINSERSDELLKCESLRFIMTGGDKVDMSYVNRIINDSTIYVINHYGPTETTIGSASYIVTKQNLIEFNAHQSIGNPIHNAQIHILNTHQKLAPIGVIGEICISGVGLARGYLNQEELTKEKFIANPFKEGKRLYKTGDLGRWLADGNIQFIGRKNDQVKIRGYRIELGEIEHTLLENEQIKEAVVVAKENQSKEKELVAYITAKTKQNTSELRSYLKAKLPEYMLPAYFVQLEILPLNSNGKIDKKSLPNPEGLGLTSGIEYVPPRNEIEEKLVRIWEEVLQRENIGVKDNFFALGGHSLKAVRLITIVKNEFNLKLDIRNLFQNTSIELLAKEVERISWLSEINEKSDSNYNIIEI